MIVRRTGTRRVLSVKGIHHIESFTAPTLIVGRKVVMSKSCYIPMSASEARGLVTQASALGMAAYDRYVESAIDRRFSVLFEDVDIARLEVYTRRIDEMARLAHEMDSEQRFSPYARGGNCENIARLEKRWQALVQVVEALAS